MASFNSITIVGYLGADPQINEVAGRKVANFNVATNKNYTNSQGQKIEETTWFRIAVWNRQAEVVEKYMKKGDMIYVEGELSTRDYKDNNDVNRTSLEVMCNTFKMLSTKSSGGGQSYQGGGQPQQQPAQSNTSEQASEPAASYGGSGSSSKDDTDDLPF